MPCRWNNSRSPNCSGRIRSDGADVATFFAGKWHLGGEGYHPEDQGFVLNAGGHRRGSPPGGYFSPYENPKLTDGPEGEHLPERLGRETAAFLETVGDSPFLAVLSFYSVHTPLQSRADLRAKYEAKAATLVHEGERFLPEGERQARQVQDHAVYAGMVEAMDTAVGHVLDTLERLGLADRTAVILTSDNGGLSTSEGSPTSNVPLRAGKGWMYEGGLRVPLLVRAPGVTSPGSRTRVPVASMDVVPTALSLTGRPLRPEAHVDGRDLVPLLRGGEALDRDALFWHYPHYGNQGGSPSSAIRSGKHKLVQWLQDGRVELYDLEADKGETSDLAAEDPELAASLLARLDAWRASVHARMPKPNPGYR